LVVNIPMEREAVTIRFPADLLVKAKKLKFVSESLNDLAVEALAREVRRRRGWADHQRIIARSETVKAKTGIQPTSGDLIRSFREGKKQR
jgi:hypothetical protein